MKALFVASGNSASGVSPIVQAQADSLTVQGVELFLFTIKGKGLKGYLSNIRSLKKTIRQFSPDIIHAHYSLTAFVATLASKKPIVVSLMGSDVKSSNKFKPLVRFFSKYVWGATIVKTEDMRKSIRLKNAVVIPNGVNIDVFKPLSKLACRKKLGLAQNRTYLLFPANPNRPEKNFELAKQAVVKLEQTVTELIWLENVSHSDIPVWMNAADVVIMSSLWEGSPNVVKEAMACNRPIVSTDVGDVRWLFGNLDGHYLCSFDVNEMTQKLRLAFQFLEVNAQTRGRERILKLELDAGSVAKRLINIYKET